MEELEQNILERIKHLQRAAEQREIDSRAKNDLNVRIDELRTVLRMMELARS